MPDPVAAHGAKLILLGTKGGPRPSLLRSNPANLVLVGCGVYLVDCGWGTTQRLLMAGVQPQNLDAVFITHHHSDHTLELGPLLYNAWIGGLSKPIDIFGPPPLRALLHGLFEAFRFEIDMRTHDEGRSSLRRLTRVREIDAPGCVMESPEMRVMCARVRHPPLRDAYAYRFETRGRSLVFSGDTTPCPELIHLARQADVLVHEAMHIRSISTLVGTQPNARALHQHLVSSHTTAAQAGEVAARAEVGKLVLNHLVPGDDPTIRDEHWIEDAGAAYPGPILVGKDLLVV